MKKLNTSPISGAQELLPGVQATFDQLKNRIIKVYKDHGYSNVETPTIERLEVLTAKAGGDTEKQIYTVAKSSENITHATEGLRFDHTVPLARYVCAHEGELDFPFKVQQTGVNYRGERAQKGRFREFYQCDIDVVGRSKLSLAYDADVIATMLDAYASFQLETPVLARISNRKILAGLLTALGLEEQAKEISHIIDHAEKVTLEQTKASLEELKLTKDQTETVLRFMDLHGPRSEVITALNNLEITEGTFIAGVEELDLILGVLESLGLAEQISADMKIIRGLDYYTGTVFEFCLPEYKNIGSIGGGGRYDNLTAYFSDRPFPGVGGSIGLTRLFFVLNEHKLLTDATQSLLDYAIIPLSNDEVEYAFATARDLRMNGHSATVIVTDKKLGDKLLYAAKIAANGIVIGEEEVKTGELKAKDFATGNVSVITFASDDDTSTTSEATDESKEAPTVQPDEFFSDDPETFL
ncbi:histidine--tRNA ligase [Candidatus Saccharibacteria bacterium]|nr:histidine--tRNA ligase [Candidatus Saccharibacteria bacterium]